MGNKVSEISTYEYDANGNRIKKNSEFIFGGRSSFAEEKYEYTYDSKGNWIKKNISETSLSAPKHIVVERKIKYF